MSKSHFVCAVLVAVFVSCGLSFAETAKELQAKGEEAYKAKDYAKAVEYYTEALKIEPERHETIYARGVNYYRLKKFDDALADFNKVKEIKKINCHALNYIGLIYMAKEDYPAAFIAFRGAVDLQPNNALYCLNTARAAVKTDNRPGALVYYKQALRIDPNNKEATQYVAARRAAVAESEKKEKADASTKDDSPRGSTSKIAALSLLESTFARCVDEKKSVEEGIVSLKHDYGVDYDRRDPGGGSRLSVVYYRIDGRPKDRFFVTYDRKGKIDKYSVTTRLLSWQELEH